MQVDRPNTLDLQEAVKRRRSLSGRTRHDGLIRQRHVNVQPNQPRIRHVLERPSRHRPRVWRLEASSAPLLTYPWRVRIDIMLLQNQPWPVLRERALRAEAMGFTGLWMADHFVNPYVPDQDWFESWTLLGAIAEATQTIRLGPMVSSLTLRNPAMLARAAMTLDHISGGRFDLGMGAGGAPLDHSMVGVPPFTPDERAERFRDSVQIVSDLLTSGATTAPEGSHYDVMEAQVRPSPVQQPLPITVAGLGKSALRVAARYGATWNTMGMARGRDLKGLLPHDEAMVITAERSATIDRFLEEEGRDPSGIRRSYLVAGTYSGATPTVPEFLHIVEDLQHIGMTDAVIYWPSEPANEAALERLAMEALPQIAG